MKKTAIALAILAFGAAAQAQSRSCAQMSNNQWMPEYGAWTIYNEVINNYTRSNYWAGVATFYYWEPNRLGFFQQQKSTITTVVPTPFVGQKPLVSSQTFKNGTLEFTLTLAPGDLGVLSSPGAKPPFGIFETNVPMPAMRTAGEYAVGLIALQGAELERGIEYFFEAPLVAKEKLMGLGVASSPTTFQVGVGTVYPPDKVDVDHQTPCMNVPKVQVWGYTPWAPNDQTTWAPFYCVKWAYDGAIHRQIEDMRLSAQLPYTYNPNIQLKGAGHSRTRPLFERLWRWGDAERKKPPAPEVPDAPQPNYVSGPQYAPCYPHLPQHIFN